MRRAHTPDQPHDSEYRECDECGRQYDLARQDYYGPLCPGCTDNE